MPIRSMARTNGPTIGPEAEVSFRRRAGPPPRSEVAGGHQRCGGRPPVRRSRQRDGRILALHDRVSTHAQAAREPEVTLTCPRRSSTPRSTSDIGNKAVRGLAWRGEEGVRRAALLGGSFGATPAAPERVKRAGSWIRSNASRAFSGAPTPTDWWEAGRVIWDIRDDQGWDRTKRRDFQN